MAYVIIGLTLIMGKIMEQLIWDLINTELREGNIITASHRGIMESISFQTNLISFF